MTIKIITADNLAALETAVNAYVPPEGKVAGTPIQLAGGPWAVMIPLTDETSSDDDPPSGGDDDPPGDDTPPSDDDPPADDNPPSGGGDGTPTGDGDGTPSGDAEGAGG